MKSILKYLQRTRGWTSAQRRGRVNRTPKDAKEPAWNEEKGEIKLPNRKITLK